MRNDIIKGMKEFGVAIGAYILGFIASLVFVGLVELAISLFDNPY